MLSTSAQPEDIIKSSMSALNEDIINEVVLAVASPAEEDTTDIRMRKLESLEFQKEVQQRHIDNGLPFIF
jgi:hypothetical protein